MTTKGIRESGKYLGIVVLDIDGKLVLEEYVKIPSSFTAGSVKLAVCDITEYSTLDYPHSQTQG